MTGGTAGLYGPGSEAWRLNREAMLLLGAGPRALLLQLAHPLVAEGVDQHSTFRVDPWARLQGTLRSYLRIVYGAELAASVEIARLNALHRAIRGPVRDAAARERTGLVRYAARDPELALWVHATLVDSTLAAADAWLEPLPRARRAGFYAETLPIARAFGIPDRLVPPDIDAFDAYLVDMLGPAGPVHVTPTARALSSIIVHPPLGPLADLVRPPVRPLVRTALDRLPPGLYDWTLWPSLGLLPAALRADYGFRWGPRERLVSAWLVAAWRGWRPIVPTGLRWMPQALAADRRIRRAA